MLAAGRAMGIAFLVAVSVLSIANRDDAPPQSGIEGAWVSNANNEVVISGTRTARTPDGASSPFNDSDAPGDRRPSPPLRDRLCERSETHLRLCPETATPPEPQEAAEADPGIPAITIADLAQFEPVAVATVGEPDNVGVAGMPMNFVATASAHTRAGTLFGTPLSVRFTPAGYDFVYGDGESITSATGGRTWAALGQAQFTPTETSHTYRERGTYQARVTLRYTAEVDLGDGWFPVPGELAIAGPTSEIRIFEAHTALVARTCVEQPTASGC